MDLQPWELPSDGESVFVSDSEACPDDNGSVTWQESPKFCPLFFAEDKDVKEEPDSEPFCLFSDEVPFGPAAVPPIRPYIFDITDEDSDEERSVDAIAEEHLAVAASAAVHDAESEGGLGAAQGDNVAPSDTWCEELKMMCKELEANITIIMDHLDHLCTANAVAPTQVAAVATITATGQDTGTQTYRQEGPVASIWAEEVIVRGQQVAVEDGGAWKYVTIVLFCIATLWTVLQVTLDG
ncbi:hypothetical protein BBO_00504 [Beauveria brongniartii RCEF 3172]|uniref:Uncharacterized protein n=1 Tax=Beauveria brongniartii RCEF 3172 TaxID=1081107 RepID=A0A167L5S4_9HYPO|nr:hypothetical protein BBO_00504 [Beauveria brongniartii RCEF 3172]